MVLDNSSFPEEKMGQGKYEEDSIIARNRTESHQNVSDKEELFPDLESPNDLIGQKIDRYKVISKLGQGGMAEVYKVYDADLELHYALKLIGKSARSAETMGGQEIERFKREAKVAAKLRHPNIVSVYHRGEFDGRFFLVMDLVDGAPLGEYVEETKASVTECMRIMKKLAQALQYAHDQKVIHRDLKPANVMVSSKGEPMIMDFGMAKPINIESKLTMMGQVVGTPSYMAPEQAQGRVHDIDPRTDVYGLGAILYELLTGRPPFVSKTIMATLMAVVREDPLTLHEIILDLPLPVSKICHKALQKHPKNRFSSCQKMAEAIDRFLNEDKSFGEELSSTLIYALEDETEEKTSPFDDFAKAVTAVQEVPLPRIPSSKQEDQKKRIGKYIIQKEIARGGMGVIYLGEDLELKRTVAIKVLISGQHASDDERRRFLREAQMAAKLNHPRLVAVHHIGVCEEGDYFVMDYFQGQDLDEIMEKQGEKMKENLPLCCNITEKILEGLAYAHKNDVIHRDIKPANILAKGKEIKITDFGLAREMNPEDRLTQAGTFLGTPVYTPPEQIQGKYDEMDGRSDLYSVGIVLYELVTQSVPFRSKTFAEIARKVVYDEPVSPRICNPDVPRDLEIIILKAIEKDSSNRYASAEEFREDLIRFRRGEPIKAVPPSFNTIFQRKLKKNKATIISLVASVFLISIAYAYIGSSAQETIDEGKKALAIEQKAIEEKEKERQKQVEAQIAQKLGLVRDYIEQEKFDSAMNLSNEIISEDESNKVAQELIRLVDKKKKEKVSLLLTKAKKWAQQESWLEMRSVMEEAIYLDPDNLEVKHLLEIASETKVTLEFVFQPKDAEFILYPIKDYQISKSPFLTGKTSEIARIESNQDYLLEIRHEGYIPWRNIIQVKKTLDQGIHQETGSLVQKDKKNKSMVYIPGGNVILGRKDALRRPTLAPKTYTEKPFLIDQYEVTNYEYFVYLKKSKRSSIEKFWPQNWTKGKPPQGEKNIPVRYISWEQAESYSIFYGKDLPTRSQWELAALATDRRDYPWGKEKPSKGAREKSLTCLFSSSSSIPASVGTMKRDISPYGVYDMAGNISEWVKEKWGGAHVIRGGNYIMNPNILRKTDLSGWAFQVKRLKDVASFTGFRCVKNLDK